MIPAPDLFEEAEALAAGMDLESLSPQERGDKICADAWRLVLLATLLWLAHRTAKAWQLEAIHATTPNRREAAKRARSRWLLRTKAAHP